MNRFFFSAWLLAALTLNTVAQQPDRDILSAESTVFPTVEEASEETMPPAESAGGEEEKTVAEKRRRQIGFFLEAGELFVDEGEYESAERAYLRALEEDPGNPAIRFRLSTLYIFMEEFVEAEKLLAEFVEEFPDNAGARNNLAWIYATGSGIRNAKKALYHARETIIRVPHSPGMWNTLAEAYYLAGDYKKALRSSEHAIGLLSDQRGRDEQIQEFLVQRTKIARAAQALKVLQGEDDF